MEVVRECVKSRTYDSEGAYKKCCESEVTLRLVVGQLGIDDPLT